MSFSILVYGLIAGSDADNALVAIRSGDQAALTVLLDSGLSVNATAGQFDESLLNHAALHGQQNIAELLIQRGADVNKLSAGNTVTPLMRSSHRCQPNFVRMLLKAGADPNRKSGNSFTGVPLSQAAGSDAFHADWVPRGSCVTTIALLLDAGAQIDQRGDDDKGQSALSLAIVSDSIDVLKLLLKRGANPNLPTYGQTPLHIAIENIPVYSNFDPKEHTAEVERGFSMIRALIEAGADKKMRSKGKTLEAYVRQKFSADTELAIEIDRNTSQLAAPAGSAESAKTYYTSKCRQLLRMLSE